MVNFCSFLWGVALGSSVIYQSSPRYYNPIKENVFRPTAAELKKDELNGWDICSTIYTGIKTSAVQIWKSKQ